MTITPGPWKLKFEPIGNPADHSDFPFAHFLAGKDDEWDEVSNTGFHLAGIMNEDDARCMAASREMLAALKDAENFILANPQLYPHADTSPTIMGIRETIDRAEGRS